MVPLDVCVCSVSISNSIYDNYSKNMNITASNRDSILGTTAAAGKQARSQDRNRFLATSWKSEHRLLSSLFFNKTCKKSDKK